MGRNGQGTSLTVVGKKRRFVEGLVLGQGIASAATDAGVSARTGYRWMHRADVRGALGRAQDAALADLAAKTLQLAQGAAQKLGELMTAADSPPYVQVQAGKALLDAGLRLYELRILAERVAALERGR